jgi:hypothetical protein
MWLHLEEADATANDMVLTASDEGDIIVHHKEKTDKAQQWYWNADGTLSVGGPNSDNKLGGSSGETRISKTGRKWWYNSEKHTIERNFSDASGDRNSWMNNKFLAVPKQALMPGSNVSAQMARKAEMNMNYKWRIEYCDTR